MPQVFNVPGVPPLSSYASGSISLLLNDVVNFLLGPFFPQWGIFLNGFPVVLADSVISLEYKQEWTISDYPVEQGAFESYDKVQTPFHARIRFATGGSEQSRQAFLDSIAAIAGTLTLFDVVTPEEVYQSVNVSHYEYNRTATSGVGLIAVDVLCIEVRVTATQTFSNTKAPSGAAPVSSGNGQPVAFNPSPSPTFQ